MLPRSSDEFIDDFSGDDGTNRLEDVCAFVITALYDDDGMLNGAKLLWFCAGSGLVFAALAERSLSD